ncbi:VTC domain-containing protein [Gracilibacillus salitolerans]|uniref:VTC domain-containing protein n=1 Tax=Gracilibacillus salitolerans TaxID=2663022 RepID=A0A5Q2TSE1_9BACI|nr:polyphosphate polymerase domain-containing protein [Gracilibacillus salitolerans]QGH35688.1 VTC domain-containing protein [Gracilibacillus salitolerans]
MVLEIFTRREQKYLITKQQYEKLIEKTSFFMRPDKFGVDGKYTVISLYFDSLDHKIYYETKNKLRFRQKLRLRVYDNTDIEGPSFFEVKQKHNNVVNKRRMLLPLSEAYRYLDESKTNVLDSIETSNPQVLREIENFRTLYGLQPEMVVSYDRHALHGIDNAGLRMTFDFNLRCRNTDLRVENGAYGDNFIDENLGVLEVKVNDSVPLWLTRILQEINCEQRSASKFCTSLELLKQPLTPSGMEKEQVLAGGN